MTTLKRELRDKFRNPLCSQLRMGPLNNIMGHLQGKARKIETTLRNETNDKIWGPLEDMLLNQLEGHVWNHAVEDKGI